MAIALHFFWEKSRCFLANNQISCKIMMDYFVFILHNIVRYANWGEVSHDLYSFVGNWRETRSLDGMILFYIAFWIYFLVLILLASFRYIYYVYWLRAGYIFYDLIFLLCFCRKYNPPILPMRNIIFSELIPISPWEWESELYELVTCSWLPNKILSVQLKLRKQNSTFLSLKFAILLNMFDNFFLGYELQNKRETNLRLWDFQEK